MNKSVKAVANKCQSCGNDMLFNPDIGDLECPSCKKRTIIKSASGFNFHALTPNLSTKDTNKEWIEKNKSMECPNCGAYVVLNNTQASSKCPYCNTDLVASLNDFKGLKPDAITPFSFGKETAVEKFKTQIKNKMFVSNKFKESISTNQIHGYYFPAFVFNAECYTVFKGTLYNEERTRDDDGNVKVNKKYFNISGAKSTKHDQVLIESSSHLSQVELSKLKPFDLTKTKQFEDDFVFGFEMEYYNNSVDNSYAQAQEIMKQDAKKSILQGFSYDGISSFEMTNTFSNPQYSYLLLPLYRINYSHKDKKYSNLMNGQTGKLTGSYPKSALKITMFVLGISLIFILPLLIFLIAFLNII